MHRVQIRIFKETGKEKQILKEDLMIPRIELEKTIQQVSRQTTEINTDIKVVQVSMVEVKNQTT